MAEMPPLGKILTLNQRITHGVLEVFKDETEIDIWDPAIPSSTSGLRTSSPSYSKATHNTSGTSIPTTMKMSPSGPTESRGRQPPLRVRRPKREAGR